MVAQKAASQPGPCDLIKKCLLVVPVLFTEEKSNYLSVPGASCWNKQRNALTYFGNHAVICHPPCRLFSKLKSFSTADESEKQLAYHALNLVRRNGGILEHPAGSSLWREKNLPLGSQVDQYCGFTISLNQFWFGHPAKKNTWLYICGISRSQVPALPLNFDRREFCVSAPNRNTNLTELPKALRNHTPILFARYLINLAILIESNKNTKSIFSPKFQNHEN